MRNSYQWVVTARLLLTLSIVFFSGTALAATDDEARRTGLAMKDKIETHWLRPMGTDGRRAVARISLNDDGHVNNVSIVRQSGSSTFDRSVEKAIWTASPLPMPRTPSLTRQFREIDLVFDPSDVPRGASQNTDQKSTGAKASSEQAGPAKATAEARPEPKVAKVADSPGGNPGTPAPQREDAKADESQGEETQEHASVGSIITAHVRRHFPEVLTPGPKTTELDVRTNDTLPTKSAARVSESKPTKSEWNMFLDLPRDAPARELYPADTTRRRPSPPSNSYGLDCGSALLVHQKETAYIVTGVGRLILLYRLQPFASNDLVHSYRVLEYYGPMQTEHGDSSAAEFLEFFGAGNSGSVDGDAYYYLVYRDGARIVGATKETVAWGDIHEKCTVMDAEQVGSTYARAERFIKQSRESAETARVLEARRRKASQRF